MFNLKSIKTQLIIYLAVVAVALAVKESDFSFLGALAIAVFTAVFIEAFILYLKTKAFKVTESSIITGMIIGYVLSSDEIWWKFVLAALLAISSKYIIVFKKKHIFNPAAFGVFLSILILGVSTQWKGTYMWYLLVPFGFYAARKIKKTEIIIGYAIVSLALFGIQAVSHNILQNKEELLEEWLKVYKFELNEAHLYYSTREDILPRLKEYFAGKKEPNKYALTLHTGANLITSYVNTQTIYCYLPVEDFKRASLDLRQVLDLKELKTGGNFYLINPYYKSATFFNTQVIKGYNVVSNLQLYLDLYHFLQRGRDHAEYLLKTLKEEGKSIA